MGARDKTRRLALLLALLMIAGALAGTVFGHRSQPVAITRNPSGESRQGSSLTLNPQDFAGRARQSYEIARKKPSLLTQLHCYCGCDKLLGHRNLLDCHRDNHAASCGTCMGETIDSSQMNDQGSPVEQIRDALRARYEFAE